MTPAARVQSAIQILDQVIAAAKGQGAPADRIIADWARANRYAGSKDRRAIREHVYTAIRACGPVPHSGRAAMLRAGQDDADLLALFDGSVYGPAAIVEAEPVGDGGIAPTWLEQKLAESGISGHAAHSLLERAPLDLRINTLKGDAAGLALPLAGEPLLVPGALRLPSGTQVEDWQAYKDGQIEVQDAGSQVACMAVGAAPSELVIDMCAGAGGKTLALASAMANQGVLIAADSDRRRLGQLAPRAERAGARIAETVLLNPGEELAALKPWAGKADAVLIDAPCSGTGTWRRNPEGRWRLTQRELEKLTALQQRLMQVGAALVKPGGRLVYVTCSLLDEEGARQVEAFLATHPHFDAAPLDHLPLGTQRGRGIRLQPDHDGTDGFFIASLSRAC